MSVLVVATFILFGCYSVSRGFAASNTYYLAPNGNDANSCGQSDPCRTFNRAYQIAALGSIVELAGGTYTDTFQNAASQTLKGELITNSPAKSMAGDQPDVTFQPAPGATVKIDGNIRVQGASHLTFIGIEIVDAEAYNYDPNGIYKGEVTDDVTFQNMSARNFQIISASNILIKGGEYGPASACGSAQPTITQYGGQNNALRKLPGAPDPFNITIDGAIIHNIMSYDLVGCHTEGLAIFAGSNVTVRNSKFYGNDVYDILAQANSGASPLGAITLENNWFAQPTNSAGTGGGQATVDYASNSNITVKHNSFNGGLMFERYSTFDNVNITGNVGYAPRYYVSDTNYGNMCGSLGVTAQYNVFKDAYGGTCNTATNANLGTAALPYVNPAIDASMDYHLIAGSSAIDLVPIAASGLTSDIDCRPRPHGPANDAGASEFGAVGSCQAAAPTGTPAPPPATASPGGVTSPPAPNTSSSNNVTAPGSAGQSPGVSGSQKTAITKAIRLPDGTIFNPLPQSSTTTDTAIKPHPQASAIQQTKSKQPSYRIVAITATSASILVLAGAIAVFVRYSRRSLLTARSNVPVSTAMPRIEVLNTSAPEPGNVIAPTR